MARPEFEKMFGTEHTVTVPAGDFEIEVMPRNPNSFTRLDPYAASPVTIALKGAQGNPLPEALMARINAKYGDVSENIDKDRDGKEHLIFYPALKSDGEIYMGSWAPDFRHTLGVTREITDQVVAAVKAVSHAANTIEWPLIELPAPPESQAPAEKGAAEPKKGKVQEYVDQITGSIPPELTHEERKELMRALGAALNVDIVVQGMREGAQRG